MQSSSGRLGLYYDVKIIKIAPELLKRGALGAGHLEIPRFEGALALRRPYLHTILDLVYAQVEVLRATTT